MKKTNDKALYINREISSEKEDLLGITPQVESIIYAIDAGASMVGVVGDFGSGKSSIGELLKEKDKEKEIIKINMWDSLHTNKSDTPDDDAIIDLDKTFLYQLAYNSNKKNLAKHVNKRLNRNNGFISFTLKSASFWWFFAFAILCIVIGIVIQASDLSFKVENYKISNEIYVICYLASAIFLIIWLRNGSVAFSSWKSEGEKRFDSSDVFSIFSEIIDCLRKDKRKKVVIIEDLDRINEKDYKWITVFIKEVYRFSNLSKGCLSFIISIKPQAKINTVSAKESLDYGKIFDYIVELKPIHIDDLNSILKSLIDEHMESLKVLMSMDNNTNIYAEFSLLISEKNLDIRKLKHRLNSAVLLYQSLKEKCNNETTHIEMRTCCLVVYLQNQYEKDYYALLAQEDLFNAIIEESYNLRLTHKLSLESQIASLKDFIKRQKTERPNVSPFNDTFCDELARFLINGLISDDYRQYFYSYPKGSYIKTIEESELENLILFANNDISNEKLDLLVKKSIARGGIVIKNAIEMLRNRNLVIPSFVLINENLFEYCYEYFPKEIIKLMKADLLWTEDNADHTVEALTRINKFSFSQKTTLFEKYAAEIASQVSSLGSKALTCRSRLIKVLGENIQYFSAIFYASGSPALTIAEIESIENEDALFAIFNERYSIDILKALCNKCLYRLKTQNYQKLIKVLHEYIKSHTTDKSLAFHIISLLKSNSALDDILFDYILDSNYEKELVEYVNSIGGNITDSYCNMLDKYLFVGQLSDIVIEKMYNNKCYMGFLANALKNNIYVDKCFDDRVITPDILKTINNKYPELFTEFRRQLLLQSKEIKHIFRFVFNSPFSFISIEKDMFRSEDCTQLFTESTIQNNIKEYVDLCNTTIHESDDLYKIAEFVLTLNINESLNVFEQLDFIKGEYRDMNYSNQEEILKLYEQKADMNNSDSNVEYMKLTHALNESLEQKILQDITDNVVNDSVINKYIDLLNVLNDCTETTLCIIDKISLTAALPPTITDKLYRNGQTNAYIIGKTLYDKKFEYKPEINLKDYRQIYITLPNVACYMINSQQFLDAIYFSKDYSLLNKEQIFIYKSWNQFYELFKAAMEIAENDDERKQYIMAMQRFETITDSDQIVDYLIATNQFVSILLDAAIYEHIKNLIWTEHYWKKTALTRFINKAA